MPEKLLKPNDTFYVKEDVLLNLIISGAFGVFFVIAMVTSFDSSGSYINFFAIPFFLGPTVFFAIKAFKNRTIMVINKTGIYYHGTLITDWPKFHNAMVKEEEKLGRVSDNFMLFIYFYKTSTSTNTTLTKIKLTNTQSQSEEAIVAAIKYFNRMAKQ